MSSVPRKPLLAPMAVFRPAPLPECAVSAWCSPAEVFEPCETLRAARPVHGPVPTTIRGSGDVRYANSAIQQIDPALASALPVSHTALSRSSSASSPALAFPTLPATRGRFTHVHRLTGQSFVTFPGLRCSEVVERCPGAGDRAAVDGGGSCHRRIAADTSPIDGVSPRALGGCQADLE